MAKLKATFGEACTIDKLNVGLGSIHLDGVKLAFNNAPYEVHIEELRLGYSLKSLLRGAGDLEKTAEEITLFRPRLTLHYTPKTTPDADVDISLKFSKETENFYRSIIKEYDYIKKITISEGEVLISNSNTSKETRVAKRVNGWAYTDNKNRAWLRVAGHFFESDEYNLVMYGQLDLDRGSLDFLNVDLHDYKIGNEIPFLIPNYFEVLNGCVNGHLIVTETVEPTRGFNIEGDLNLQSGQLKLQSENIYVDHINIDAEIQDWNLEIKNSSQLINGSPVTLSGRIRNLLDPEFDLRLVSNEIDIEKFFQQFLPEKRLPFKGKAALDALITESLSVPRVRGEIRLDSLWFVDRRIDDFAAAFSFDDLFLRFGTITGRLAHAELSGDGKIEFLSSDKLLDFDFRLDGDLTEEIHDIGLTSADQCLGKSEIRVFGSIMNPVSRGEFEVAFKKESVESLLLNGSFSYHQGNILLSASSSDEDFHFTANAKELFSEPDFDFEAINFEKIFVFINNPLLDFIRDRYNLNLTVEGIGKHPDFVLDGYRRDNFEKLFQIVSDSTSVEKNKFVGDISIFPNSNESTKGDFELDILDDSFKLTHFALGDVLRGTLDLSKGNFLPYAGKLEISDLKLSRLLTLLGEVDPEYEGELFGRITVHGELGSPEYSGNVWLLDGFLRDVGPLTGELSFQSNQNTFTVKKLALEKSEATNILAKGQIDLATHDVDATIAASEVDVNDIVKIVTGADGIVQGEATVQVSLKGQLPRLPIYGDIRFRNVKILQFEFDEALWDFGSEVSSNGSYLSDNQLYVGHATLDKYGQFSFGGDGLLPFRGGEGLDVRLSGDGNFLSLLSDIESFFVASESEGHMDLHLTGRYTEPKFTGSKFRCQNGTLRLSSVAKKVENIEAEFEVLPEDYFLSIVKLRGTIQGEPFSISNTRALTGLNHSVHEPLMIAEHDLNLGALILKTSADGVPINIPGLMERGEKGRYALAGRTSGEEFFVAGPWHRPYVRGEIRVQNANLMYPYENGVAKESSIVMNILNNIEWDVRAIPKKDTRYVKQFATGIYVNLEVSKENSELEFTGVLKDSTFRIGGRIESSRGEFEYLDLTFRVERFGAEFDRTSLYPVIHGKAWTVVRDSTNVPYDIYLQLFSVDDANQEVKKGRWDRLNIKLSSEHPGYQETQGELMATLGYSSETVEKQATKAVGYSTDKLIFRPLMRPIERELERALGLDVVRFSYAITRNFLDANFNNDQLRSSLELLRSSRLLLGKYLTDDIYLLYTGEIKAGIDYQFQDKGVGLQHVLGLEYRLNARWLLQMEYDYNTLFETDKDDKKVWLRHSFPF